MVCQLGSKRTSRIAVEHLMPMQLDHNGLNESTSAETLRKRDSLTLNPLCSRPATQAETLDE